MLSETKLHSALRLAEQLAHQLAANERHIVFAESCTGGLVSALMASVSGISAWMCGSIVTYMDSSKIAWLGIAPELIDQHTSVSPEVTQAMAAQVLQQTVAADVALAVTGHLEPPDPDVAPHVYVCIADRCVDGVVVGPVERRELTEKTRVSRQYEAAMIVLHHALPHLGVQQPDDSGHAEWCEACERLGHASWIRWA